MHPEKASFLARKRYYAPDISLPFRSSRKPRTRTNKHECRRSTSRSSKLHSTLSAPRRKDKRRSKLRDPGNSWT